MRRGEQLGKEKENVGKNFIQPILREQQDTRRRKKTQGDKGRLGSRAKQRGGRVEITFTLEDKGEAYYYCKWERRGKTP